ncbi:MAG: hypothetical protein O3B84_05185, partial [Chloroflexi bacterium]|nr:hypothetical protein [Chloroflexota bacterium]
MVAAHDDEFMGPNSLSMIRGALIGFGVALACFIPPILHFILAPLSPFIGGFVGGLQARSRSDHRLAPLG